MSKSQGPETFRKRLRERKVQEKRLAKIAKRNELNAKKREAKRMEPPAPPAENPPPVDKPAVDGEKPNESEQK